MTEKKLLLFTIFLSGMCVFARSTSSNFSSSGDHSGDEAEYQTVVVTNSTELRNESVLSDRLTNSSKFDFSLIHTKRQCDVKLEEIIIRYPNCLRQRVNVRGCAGFCTSSAIPIINDDQPHYETSCKCCKATGTRVGRVFLRCIRNSKWTKTIAHIEGVQSCNCRPCSRLSDDPTADV